MGNDDRQYSYCSCLKWFYRLSGSQDLRWALQIRKSLNDLKTKRRRRIRLKASGRSSPDLNWMVQLSAAGLWWHLSMVIHDFRQQSWRRNHWPVGWESSCPWYTYNRMAKYRELLKIRDSFLMPSTAKEKYWINLKLTLDIGFYITALGSSHRNNALYKTDGTKVISDGELTAMTLMIAESVSKEKDIMTTMVMNFLTI